MDTCIEMGLPRCLVESINNFTDEKNKHVYECVYMELQSEINVCEQEQLITPEQAWFLREKYLGLDRKNNGG